MCLPPQRERERDQIIDRNSVLFNIKQANYICLKYLLIIQSAVTWAIYIWIRLMPG